MKHKIIIPALVVLLLHNTSFAQSPTKKFSNNELYSLARVWGFLKYYHPAVSQGKANWDSVLLSTLADKATATQSVARWLIYADGLAFDTTKQPNVSDQECDSIDYRNYNLSWIKQDKLLSVAQKTRLQKLAVDHPHIGSYYSAGSDHRFSAKNEKKYPDSLNESFRLLNLFRAWNIIEYFYPYKYALDHKWDVVLKQSIPEFRTAITTQQYTIALMRFAACIDDTHTELTPTPYYEFFGAYGPPFAFLYIDSVAVVTRVVNAEICKAAGIDVGDVITSADNKPLPVVFRANKQYMPASNPSVQRRDVFFHLFNGHTTSMTIRGYKKDNTPFTKKVERIKRNYMGEWFKNGTPDNPLLELDTKTQQLIYARVIDNTGYIDFQSLQVRHIDSLMRMMANTKGLIIDLRGYTDDGNLLKICNYLLPDSVFFGKKTQPSFATPGQFCHVGYIINKYYTYIGKKNDNAYRGKVVLLINETTQSAMEMWAMVFKKIPHVTVIGSQTAGADGNITHIPLTDGKDISFSGLGIFYPNGGETQRIGIVPDIKLRPTVKDIQADRDVLLEKAKEVIKNSK